MHLEFDAEVIEWRGPAPFLFAVMPEPQSAELRDIAKQVTYGWGCIPASAEVGDTAFTTSLFPRGGGFLVPMKVAVQRAEGIALGDVVHVRLTI
ncbi:uncharacterized protein DUF1905 [Yimella lutea]|uniref:Uncharacterized protein DUF1905 n=1 Tax=Yimella lutea TaxID=587872 RepID=A0A542EBU4_9MICO|nr:DUF1905 domain-containing protein [Yimella lutea]TQJ12808.1 uncharacterized protein DUF1905 [Yimella lutea]